MGYFSSYIPTVRALFEDFDAELSKYIVDSNIDEEWVNHDNWNGGIDFYNLIVNIPVELFKRLKKRGGLEEAENELDRCYAEAMRGEGESLQINSLLFRPSTAEVPQLGSNYKETMWKPGYYRLFISHLTENKLSASNLKGSLLYYGVDGFVAHEDITPSKEWEREIEAALFTLDALCAIVVPKFGESKWCDQEVGIALGRRKMVFSIKKGQDPYGFFGKYQAIPSQEKASDMARDVVKTICANEMTRGEYFTKLVNLIINASSVEISTQFIGVLKEADYLDKQYVELLHENIGSNQTILKNEVMAVVNPLFKKYGLEEIEIRAQESKKDEDWDLPF